MPTSDSSSATGTEWLTPAELAAWRGFVTLAQRLPAALEQQLQADSRLSFMEYYVLALLSEEPERTMRMSTLAAHVHSELSRLSHLVKRLEGRGLVRRQTDPTNGRYTQAVLTSAGYRYLAKAAPGHVARVRELFVDALDPGELEVLLRSAAKVVARIDGGAAEAD